MNYFNQLLNVLNIIINSYCDKLGSRCVLVLNKKHNYPLAIKDLCEFLIESNVEYQLFDSVRLERIGISLKQLQEINPSSLVLDALDLDSISPERLSDIKLVLVYKFAPSSWSSLTCFYMTIKKAKEVIEED